MANPLMSLPHSGPLDPTLAVGDAVLLSICMQLSSDYSSAWFSSWIWNIMLYYFIATFSLA